MGEGKLDLAIGNLLFEIFRGGPSIALSVKEEHITTMMTLLFTEGSCSSPAISNALTELLMVWS